MFLPAVVKAAYAQTQYRLGLDPYAAWSAAVRRLQEEYRQDACPTVGRLRDYLDGIPADQRGEVLQDLIAEQMRLSWQRGRGYCVEDYVAEFGRECPLLAGPADVPVDLVEDEFLARYCRPHGDTPSLAAYRGRYPHRPDIEERLAARFLGQGRYAKLQLLGRGAMGDVHAAYDHCLRRQVAIKEPRLGSGASVSQLERFTAEVLVTAELEHPAIVTLHEHDPGEVPPFYVMRLASGRTLTEWIQDHYQPPMERTREEQRIVWQRLLQAYAVVCGAMAYAHSRGVLHRDLKPGNILVGHFDEVAILDWGMAARAETAIRQPSTDSPHGNGNPRGAAATSSIGLERSLIVGTPQYMPPEQADGAADEQSDVFGLGGILYEMLTGLPPHAWPEGALPADWVMQVRQPAIPRPRQINPRSPRALEAICLKALSPGPADRYATASDLEQDVHRYLAGVPPTAVRQKRWFNLR